jgi:hypothetical protein
LPDRNAIKINEINKIEVILHSSETKKSEFSSGWGTMLLGIDSRKISQSI